MPKGIKVRVRVDGVSTPKPVGVPPPKPKPSPVPPAPAPLSRDAAMTKWMTSTEALTPAERLLIRELRQVGPMAAARSLSRLRQAKTAQRQQQPRQQPQRRRR